MFVITDLLPLVPCPSFQANILQDQPHCKNHLSTDNEVVHAQMKLKRLWKIVSLDQNLRPFAVLAEECLQADFRRRPTASQLLAKIREIRQ